uniref:Uncharacterized protein n=1 Tax=Timema monikensis TaxID=170555 RepID=A0A7R9E557_9NEOP|nr:unnamed protein product [Timema monikensis]
MQILICFDLLRSSLTIDSIANDRKIESDQICYAVLCVFSYIAAGQEQKRQQGGVEPQGATPTRRH